MTTGLPLRNDSGAGADTPGDDALPFDESTRPTAPPIDGATPEQRQRGGHLAMVHRIHLQELHRIRTVIDHIEAGERVAADLAEAMSSLQMARNCRLFSNLCGRECMALTFHHDAEETMVFPLLSARGSEGLKKVVERLKAEHEVVHALLEEMEAGAKALEARPDLQSFNNLKRTFQKLHRVVVSHFGYEEKELEEALGYYELV